MPDPSPRPVDGADAPAPPRDPSAPHPAWLAALRGMARVIDVMIIVVIVGGVARGVGATDGREADITAVIFNVLLVAYWVAAETMTGTTIGKRLFGLRVRDLEGEHPSVKAALGRNIAPALAVVGGVLGVLFAVALGISIVTGGGNGLHDRVVGTRVAVAARR